VSGGGWRLGRGGGLRGRGGRRGRCGGRRGGRRFRCRRRLGGGGGGAGGGGRPGGGRGRRRRPRGGGRRPGGRRRGRPGGGVGRGQRRRRRGRRGRAARRGRRHRRPGQAGRDDPGHDPGGAGEALAPDGGDPDDVAGVGGMDHQAVADVHADVVDGGRGGGVVGVEDQVAGEQVGHGDMRAGPPLGLRHPRDAD